MKIDYTYELEAFVAMEEDAFVCYSLGIWQQLEEEPLKQEKGLSASV